MTIPSEGENIPTFEQFHFYRLLKYESKDICKDIPSGIIYNNRKLKTVQMSIHTKMDEEIKNVFIKWYIIQFQQMNYYFMQECD